MKASQTLFVRCLRCVAGVLLSLVVLIAALRESAWAQDSAEHYPERPVRVIVPFVAGGPADILARIIAKLMSEAWKQPVVVEDRPGGNTAIGAQAVANAAPDGYTLLVALDTTMVLNPLVSKDPGYQPLKDFAAISLIAKNTAVVITRASDGPKSIGELIDRAKSDPGKLTFGSATLNSRLAAVLFEKATATNFVIVPFKGSPEVVEALLSGSINFGFDGMVSALPLINSGQLRVLAKLTTRPTHLLPDLPSLADAAQEPSIGDISNWIGLFAPAGTPPAIVDKIGRFVAHAYADPAVAAQLQQAGIIAATSSPEELKSFIESETARWGRIIKENGITFD